MRLDLTLPEARLVAIASQVFAAEVSAARQRLRDEYALVFVAHGMDLPHTDRLMPVEEEGRLVALEWEPAPEPMPMPMPEPEPEEVAT